MTKLVARLKQRGTNLVILRIPGGRPSTFFDGLDRSVVKYRTVRRLGALPVWPVAQASHRAPPERPFRLPILVAIVAGLVTLTELALPRLRFRREEVA
jgi:hypothetical protein